MRWLLISRTNQQKYNRRTRDLRSYEPNLYDIPSYNRTCNISNTAFPLVRILITICRVPSAAISWKKCCFGICCPSSTHFYYNQSNKSRFDILLLICVCGKTMLTKIDVNSVTVTTKLADNDLLPFSLWRYSS